jgi:hypothetical protein
MMERDAGLRKDLLSGAVLLLLGGAYLLVNLRYPLDTLATPGPGLFPLAVGLLLVCLAALQLVRSGGTLLFPGRAAGLGLPADHPGGAPKDTQAGRRPLLMMAILVVYLMVVSWSGFLTSTFILVILCSKLMGSRGWGRPVALAFGIVLGCYFLFTVWLKVPLPTGHLM